MDLNELLNHPLFHKIMLWSLLGLGVGVIAKILLPGNENMGWIRTLALGLMGSLIGNWLTPRFLNWPEYSLFSWQGILIGIVGSLVLVIINRIVTKT